MAIFIDTSALTYSKFDIPEAMLDQRRDGSVPLDCPDLAPQTGYGFLQGGLTAFTFDMTANGTVDYAAECDGFLAGKGTDTLIVKGYAVAFDATALDHDLVLMNQALDDLDALEGLVRTTTHELVLVPTSGYGFVCSSAVLSSFTFDLDANGILSIAPEDQGFATVSQDPRALTISGYAITIDGTLLTQDLWPAILRVDGTPVQLSREQVHTLRLIPSDQYGMIVGGVAGNFVYEVNADGTVSFPPIYAGFLQAAGATLTLWGYPVVLDTSKFNIPLADAPVTRWFGLQVLIPATWPVLTVDGTEYLFTLELDGTISPNPADPQSYNLTTTPRLGLGG